MGIDFCLGVREGMILSFFSVSYIKEKCSSANRGLYSNE
jgi:hypothetical protein